ncbi:MAG: hypothetical protein RL094_333 [Candidatus Parcubacteria bacterium]|jgi:type II secretory pathway component PulF
MNKQKIIFLKKLASLLEIEMPIREALSIAAKNNKNKSLGSAIQRLIQRVNLGESLSASMSYDREFWYSLIIALVWAGELSSKLHQHLSEAADLMEKNQKFIKKVISALVYPLVIAVVSMGLIIFLLFYIYPKIIPVLNSLNIPLPFTTKVIIYVKHIIETCWYIPVFLGVVCFSLSLVKRVKNYYKVIFHTIVTTMPVIGSLFKTYNFSVAAKHIGTISPTEIGLIQSIAMASEVVTVLDVKDGLIKLITSLQKGESVSNSLIADKRFPDIWHEYSFIGERTSRLSLMFLKISNIHEREVEEKVELYSKFLEPLLMVITGGVVLFIALSIIGPMYSITQYVQ